VDKWHLAESGPMSDCLMICRAIQLSSMPSPPLGRCTRLERLLKLLNDARFGRSSGTLCVGQLQLALRNEAVAASRSGGRPYQSENARKRGLLSAETIVAGCQSTGILPLYRQSQILAAHNIAIDRSTLTFWVGYAA
jgi:hypothetical protein